jgi:hypothetical protein
MDMSQDSEARDPDLCAGNPAAGLTPAGPAEPEVTAAGPIPSTASIAADRSADEGL